MQDISIVYTLTIYLLLFFKVLVTLVITVNDRQDLKNHARRVPLIIELVCSAKMIVVLVQVDITAVRIALHL